MSKRNRPASGALPTVTTMSFFAHRNFCIGFIIFADKLLYGAHFGWFVKVSSS
jgi:hypothetical protein